MKFTEKKQLDATLRKQLMEANASYAECLQKDFLSAFLGGKDANIEMFCIAHRQSAEALSEQLGY